MQIGIGSYRVCEREKERKRERGGEYNGTVTRIVRTNSTADDCGVNCPQRNASRVGINRHVSRLFEATFYQRDSINSNRSDAIISRGPLLTLCM